MIDILSNIFADLKDDLSKNIIKEKTELDEKR